MRFELNEHGIEQLTPTSGMKGRANTGTVLRKSGNCWIVRFDNRKTPRRISGGYLTLIDDSPTPLPAPPEESDADH